MPALLLQAAAAASNSSGLAAQAAQIKANCHAQHGDTPSLVSCPECYGALLDALRTRYFGTISPSSSSLPPTTTTGGTTTSDDPSQPSNPETEQPPQQQQQQQQPPQPEWFSSRPAFLADLDALLDAAKTYQVPPQAVDDRVRAERAAWYAERVRGSLLRLLVADEDEGGMAALRRVVFERLEDSSVTAVPVAAEGGGLAPAATGASAGIQDGDDGGGDPAALARVVAEMLAQGGLRAAGAADLQRKLAAAAAAGKNRTARDVELLRDAFFTAEDGVTVPENHQRYLDMLQHEGLSMEQVVDRILEERQAAAGAKEQADKLRQRLDELRRARAAHEALKSRKAERRESLAQQKVPDELYELPACDSCGRATSPSEYFCCDICTVLATAGALPQQTVYCSVECEEKGEVSRPNPNQDSSDGYVSCRLTMPIDFARRGAQMCLRLQVHPTTSTSRPRHRSRRRRRGHADGGSPPTVQ
jgi:signal transduction histidine kinase